MLRSNCKEGLIMTSILLAFLLLTPFCKNSAPQRAPTSQSTPQKELHLNRSNDGQRVSVKVGQPIVITLQTIGGGNYGAPHVSSRAVRFESVDYPPAREQNPGGPKQVYRFTAVAVGETQIRIPHTDANPTVTFTIRVQQP
jgi:hypothetical protein